VNGQRPLQIDPSPDVDPRMRSSRFGSRESLFIALAVSLLLGTIIWFRDALPRLLVASVLCVLCVLIVPGMFLLLALGKEQLERLGRSGSLAHEETRRAPFVASVWLLLAAFGLGVLAPKLYITPDRPASEALVFGGIFVAVCVIAPLILLLVLRLALGLRRRSSSVIRRAAFVSRGLMILSVLLVTQWTVLWAHQSNLRTNAERAKQWCESIVPRLDEWNGTHGRYPASLMELGDDIQPPLPIDRGLQYYSEDNNKFAIEVEDPSAIMFPCWWVFTSESRSWRHESF